jgi:hypothetical protein
MTGTSGNATCAEGLGCAEGAESEVARRECVRSVCPKAAAPFTGAVVCFDSAMTSCKSACVSDVDPQPCIGTCVLTACAAAITTCEQAPCD